MKSYISILVIITVASFKVMACDGCGGSLGAGYFGILPQFQSHFIGFKYSAAWFNASVVYNSKYLEDQYSTDRYVTTEFMARYAVNKRIQLLVNIPYLSNVSEGSSESLRVNGIGDPRLTAYYRLLNTSETSVAPLQHALLIGAGLKFPLGEFKRKGIVDGEIDFINENVQLGTGSLDYFFSLVHTTKYQNTGLKLESAYKVNGKNRFDYRFGDQFNLSTVFFQWIKIKKSVFIPSAGIYYERAEKHFDAGVRPFNTGGKALFASFEAQLYVKQFTIGAAYLSPMSQVYNTDAQTQINAKERISFSLLYNISSAKNPFKMK